MILNVNTTDSNARLIDLEGVPSDSGLLVRREWPWTAGYGAGTDTAVMSLATALNRTSTVSNPKANNDQYSGSFVVSKVQAKDETIDGNGDRSCTIVQALAKVKATITTVAGLGTPDKGADQITLNYLGFQEGQQFHIYHKYKNINPADRAATMALAPTESGYTIVKRKFDVEDDKTGTFYVVFEKDTWPTTGDLSWTTNKIKVSFINYDSRSNTGNGNKGGAGYQEEQQLTGLSQTGYVPELVKAKKGDTHRVVTDVTVIERGDGEYQVKQRQAISFASTSDTSALIEEIQSSFGGNQAPRIRRIWPRRTLAAKAALTDTSTGSARKNFVWRSDTYVHNKTLIGDNRDGTFDVVQDLGVMTGGGGSSFNQFFTDSEVVYKKYTRTKDDKIKTRTFIHHIKAVTSEAAGWNWIRGKTAYPPVAGASRVNKRGSFYYIAECLLDKSASAWT